VVEGFKSGPSKFIEKRATGLSDITCSGTTKNYRNKHNPIELDRLPNGDAAQLTRTKLAVEPHRTWSACGLQTIINNEDTRGDTLHKLTVAVVPQHDQFSCRKFRGAKLNVFQNLPKAVQTGGLFCRSPPPNAPSENYLVTIVTHA
jgi:hypothetical protein